MGVFSSFVYVKKEVKKKLLSKKMATPSSNTQNHQNHCTICLEGLAVRTIVTLRCCHTFHLDCLGMVFNAANAMRCPVCRAVEEGDWRTFPTSAPRIGRAGARGTIPGYVQEPPVGMQQPPSGTPWSPYRGLFSGYLTLGNGGPIRRHYRFQRRHGANAHMMMGSVNGSGRASAPSHVTRNNHLCLGVNRRPDYGYSFQGNVGPDEHYDPFPQVGNTIQPVGLEAPEAAFMRYPSLNNRASAGSLFGRLAGAAPVEQSMNLASPPGHTMMHAANNRSSSQMAFQAEGSGMVDIQLPDVGEALLALSADVQPGDGIDGSSEDILSDVEETVEDLSE